MNKNSDLHESQASENQSALIFDLVGKILAAAAKRIQEQDPAVLEKMEEKKHKGSKLNIIWKN